MHALSVGIVTVDVDILFVLLLLLLLDDLQITLEPEPALVVIPERVNMLHAKAVEWGAPPPPYQALGP